MAWIPGWRRLVLSTFALLVGAVVAPEGVAAESIYAISSKSGYNDGVRLVRFDSEAPANLELSISATGALEFADVATLEFDPETRELYVFAYEDCPILCPPYPRPTVRIDPVTGVATDLGWPNLPAPYGDYDIDPATRELRQIAYYGRNFRFRLDNHELIEDTTLETLFSAIALAHTYAGERGEGVETFALSHTDLGLQLARIGGPGGQPPASSGEVTLIGPVTVQGSPQGFDISPLGTAYLSTLEWIESGSGFEAVSRLYSIDLSDASVDEIGIIATPDPGSAITGIAVAPIGLGTTVLDVPVLPRSGSVVFAVLLAAAAYIALARRHTHPSIGCKRQRIPPPVEPAPRLGVGEDQWSRDLERESFTRKRLFFWAFLLLAATPAFCGDTVYVLWGGSLSRFDSETPSVQELVLPLDPALRGNLEFDPVTRQLWSFEYPSCQITCPPARDPALIDPLTGEWKSVLLPGLDLAFLRDMDIDIDPLTRELRYFDYFGGNYSYSLDRLELRVDEPLSAPFTVVAIAHKPPVAGSTGVETYAIGHLDSAAGSAAGGSWLQLARIGGQGGIPPASSGIVTVVGPVDAFGERMAFDIAPDGTAYIATFDSLDPPDEENKLYRVDLESGALQLLGAFQRPGPGNRFTGMSVAPHGLGGGTLEVPGLSKVGLVLWSFALVAAAFRALNVSQETSGKTG